MNLPEQTKAILMDMDGVIFNTEDLAHDVFIELSHKFQKSFDENDHKEILGTAQPIWSSYFVRKWDLSISPDTFAIFFWELLEEKKKTTLKLMDGVIEFLESVQRLNYKISIVTSTPRLETVNTLRKFRLEDKFDLIVTGDDVPNGKPEPFPYLYAIEKLHVEANACVVIEDAISGVKSGKAAGCYVIAIPTIHASGLDYSEADKKVANLSEI